MFGQLPQASTPASGPSPITAGPQAGVEAQAMIKVRQAVMLLADSVSVLKSRLDSDLGKAVIASLKLLSPHTPGVQEGLGQSELMSLLSGVQGVRSAPPASPAAPGMLGMKPPQAQFMGGVNRGIAAADRGDLIDHADVVERIDRLLRP